MVKTEKEMLAEHLNNFSDDVTQIITESFKKDKGVNPTVFALMLKNNTLGIGILAGLGQFFTSDQGKEMAARIIKEASKELKPVALAFASEAWISEKAFSDYQSVVDEDGNYREGIIRPSEDPNRKEILMLNFETFDQECFHYFDIIRDGENVSLKKSICSEGWKPKKSEVKGRFMNLLEENYSELAQFVKEQLKNMN